MEVALARKAAAGPVIEQAKGMLMLAGGCTADEAFERLRLCSQLANRKVADIARMLVESPGRSAADGTSGILEWLARAGEDAATGPVSV